MSYLIGKSLYDKKVSLSPRHRKFHLLFTFESKEDAKRFYDFFDYENKKMFKQRIKIFFCNHENEHNLDVGSKLYHYIYCPSCKRAVYVNDETLEDREKRINSILIRLKEKEIKELEQEIIYKQEKLLNLKEELDARFEN